MLTYDLLSKKRLFTSRQKNNVDGVIRYYHNLYLLPKKLLMHIMKTDYFSAVNKEKYLKTLC